MKPKSIFMGLALIATATITGCKKEFAPSEPGALVPKTVDQDPSLPSISVNNTVLHAEAFGNPTDPMVIYLHGGPGGDYRNGLQLKQLVNDNYYVVFYDQRGSGLSKRHDYSSFSLQLMLDDLAAVIQHYRTWPGQKVFLFGHSWGAMLATAYINTYPNRINGVVLAEPGGLTWPEVKGYGERSRRIRLTGEASNDALYLDQFFTGKENQHELLDYKVAVNSAFTYAKGNEEGIEGPSPFWRHGAAVLKRMHEIGKNEGMDFTTHLQQFTTKVLFLFGEHNKAYGLAYAQQLAAHFPNVQLSQVNGTGHEMIYFRWSQVYPVALAYLNALR